MNTVAIAKEQLAPESFCPPIEQPFVVDQWTVYPSLNKLENDVGESKSIEPRLMHLLCFLGANFPHVVDRDTLVEQLWPRVIVNENSLTRAISELRKQLRSEDGKSHPILETIPKKGYRLVQCPVMLDEYQPDADDAQLTRQNDVRYSIVSKTKTVAIAATFALAIGSTIPSLMNLTNNAENQLLLVDELVTTEPSFQGGNLQLSTTHDESLNSQKTTKPVLSHDGLNYAYLSYDHTGSTIYLGNLAEMDDPYPVYHNQDKLLNLAWSPLGDSLLFARKPNMTTAAIFPNSAAELELLVLNIESREVKRMIQDSLLPEQSTIQESNLT